MLDNLHFLRPLWLIGLLILILIPIIKSNFIQKDSPWYRIADSNLLRALLLDNFAKKTRSIFRPILFFCWLVAIIALSGPSWEKVEVSGFSTKSNIIILSEVSPNMMVSDLKPNRLERMKYKIFDILDKLKDENIAMIVYDNYPYILSPFTNDINIIKNFANVFDTAMMPSPGANMERAMEKALELAKGYPDTEIIMLIGSDGYNPATALNVAEKIKSQGHTLSIIAIGESDPVPIPNAQGTFTKNSDGKIETTSIDFDLLKNIASKSGGVFSKITPDDTDINLILNKIKTGKTKQNTKEKITQWNDMGIYFVYILLPFALFLFKRGFLIAIVILISQPAYAYDWNTLWKNENQQGIELFTKNPKAAAEKFTDKKYKGAAEYKSKQYDKAFENFTATGQDYNAANALAHLGKTDEAIKKYEEILKTNPNHEDAKYNLEYLKKQKEQQQQHDQEQNNKQQEQQQSQQQGKSNEQSQQPQNNQGPNNPQQQQQSQGKQQQQQGQQQNQNQQPGWQIAPDNNNKNGKNDSSEIGTPNQNQDQWQDSLEKNPYGLLKGKLRLIYEKEYNNQ